MIQEIPQSFDLKVSEQVTRSLERMNYGAGETCSDSACPACLAVTVMRWGCKQKRGTSGVCLSLSNSQEPELPETRMAVGELRKNA